MELLHADLFLKSLTLNFLLNLYLNLTDSDWDILKCPFKNL